MRNSVSRETAPEEKSSEFVSALSPMRVPTITDQCYEQLKEAITSLELRPGSPLSENVLAERFGISKSPVREALARLAGEGFVTMRAGRKPHVEDLSANIISEFYEVRLLLEPASLREVAPTLTRDDFDQLRNLIEALERAVEVEDRSQYVAATEGFHLLLIQRTGNRYLYRIMRHLFDQASRVRAAIYLAEQRSAQHHLSRRGIQNHRGILDALVSRDTDHAADLLSEDIQMFLDAATSPEMQRAFEQLRTVRRSAGQVGSGNGARNVDQEELE